MYESERRVHEVVANSEFRKTRNVLSRWWKSKKTGEIHLRNLRSSHSPDSKVSFDAHVEELCKKLSQRVAGLRKIRRFIPIERRILYSNATIKQVMLYGSTWYLITWNEIMKCRYKKTVVTLFSSSKLCRCVQYNTIQYPLFNVVNVLS